jgi:hypothetical protein
MAEKFYSIDIAKPSDAGHIVDFFNARGKSLDIRGFVRLSAAKLFSTGISETVPRILCYKV